MSPVRDEKRMRAYIGWIVIICFFAGLLGIFVLFQKKSTGEPLDISFVTTTLPELDADTAAAKPASPPQNIPAGYKEYRNEQFGFSVYYPPEIPPKEFLDRGPELTVAFQGKEGEPGFQIYVAPIDGTQVTPERFRRDSPSGVMQEPRDIAIDGVPAVSFVGFDARVGKTREVWFIKGHFLFEVTTYKELDAWFSGIMQTWKFI